VDARACRDSAPEGVRFSVIVSKILLSSGCVVVYFALVSSDGMRTAVRTVAILIPRPTLSMPPSLISPV
jgi:hypothetical protein